MSTAMTTCLVCGATGTVRLQLTHWREPIGERRFDNVPRCIDRESCRRQVAVNGDAWPLADAAPKSATRRSR